MIKSFYEKRGYDCGRKLATLFRRHKKDVMIAMRQYASFVRSYKKVRVIGVIHNRFQKQIKQTAFAKLSRFNLSSLKKNISFREVK